MVLRSPIGPSLECIEVSERDVLALRRAEKRRLPRL